MLWEEVDVVGDDHQIADAEVRAHAAGRVRHEERLDAQLVHHALREGDLPHRPSFVVVEATLHGHDVLASELSEDELSAMSLNGRHREVGYVTIRNLYGISYL